MRKYKILFAPVARQDLERLFHFIQDANPAALGHAADRLKKAFELLQQHPQAGYLLDHLPPFREILIPFGKGSYIIRYRLDKKTINVVHFWHSQEKRG